MSGGGAGGDVGGDGGVGGGAVVGTGMRRLVRVVWVVRVGWLGGGVVVVMVVGATAGGTGDAVAGGEWCGWFRGRQVVMVVLVAVQSSEGW